MANMDTVGKLYKNYEILDGAGEKIGEHEKEYLEIVAAVKGAPNEKKLASQFIVRFFKQFPHLTEQAIEAQIDLCEDDDVTIRKQAIRDLPAICKENKDHVTKIADILTQLLQSEDNSEITVVNQSLSTLCKIDLRSTLNGIFQQIIAAEVDIVREKAIKFLQTKIRILPEDIKTTEIEEYIFTETRKILQDVTAAEFASFMSILSSLKVSKNVAGHQRLVDIAAEQAELGNDFNATIQDDVDKLIHCVRQAIPYFTRNIQSTKFVDYFATKVLPSFKVLPNIEGSNGTPKTDTRLEIVKLLAELAPHCGQLENHNDKIKAVYDVLLDYMPLPNAEEDTENPDAFKLEFSHVESLLFAFHQLARKSPEFLAADENAERLKDFRGRLQYFARGTQAYVKKLKEALKGKTGKELETEENLLKTVALRTTSNINSLIRDLFHVPPSYKTGVTLSWKNTVKPKSGTTPAVEATTTPTPKASPAATEQKPGSGKRHTPITFDIANGNGTPAPKKKAVDNTPRTSRELYTPPSGKYSTNVRDFSELGFGRGRGGWRGRGRGQRRPSWKY